MKIKSKSEPLVQLIPKPQETAHINQFDMFRQNKLWDYSNRGFMPHKDRLVRVDSFAVRGYEKISRQNLSPNAELRVFRFRRVGGTRLLESTYIGFANKQYADNGLLSVHDTSYNLIYMLPMTDQDMLLSVIAHEAQSSDDDFADANALADYLLTKGYINNPDLVNRANELNYFDQFQLSTPSIQQFFQTVNRKVVAAHADPDTVATPDNYMGKVERKGFSITHIMTKPDGYTFVLDNGNAAVIMPAPIGNETPIGVQMPFVYTPHRYGTPQIIDRIVAQVIL